MKALILICTVSLCSNFFCIAQQFGTEYKTSMNIADSFYKSNEFKASALTYSEAFRLNSDLSYLDDRYRAAASWALSNEPDSAFYHLSRVVNKGKYDDVKTINSDKDFSSLHRLEKWQELIRTVENNKRVNKYEKEKNYNVELIATLDSVFKDDQVLRLRMGDIEKQHGFESEEMRELIDDMIVKDSINLKKNENILDNYGWLGPDVIGDNGSITIFLVIQHSDSVTRKKYLPMMSEAVNKGYANASALALLEDRIALEQGDCQIYGSQIAFDKKSNKYYVQLIKNPQNVDIRRKKVGLQPIKDYVRQWNIDWNPNEYLKQIQTILGKPIPCIDE